MERAGRKEGADERLERVIRRFVESRTTENTRTAYRKALFGFITQLDIDSPEHLFEVTSDDVVEYRNRLQRKGLAPSTINQRLAAVRGLYGRLLKEGHVSHNPADPDLVKSFKTSDVSRTEGLSFDEVKKILATCDTSPAGLRDRALLLTLYYEGLRRSEASNLRMKDVTTRRGLLVIRNAKGGPYETIRLRPEVKDAIEKYLNVLSSLVLKRDVRPEDPVFASFSPARGPEYPLAPSSINEMVKARARIAGIKRRISAHSWRHTCTTHSLGKDVPVHQVQRHMRHRDVRTTLRYDRDRETHRNPTTDALPPISFE